MGDGRGAARPASLAADRGAPQGALEKLAEWTPPPALGAMPEAVNDPIAVMLWGITPSASRRGRGQAATARSSPARGPPGEIEGPARVVRDSDEHRRRPRRRDPRLHDHLAGVGADLQQDQGDRHRHRRRHVARGDRLPRVRDARGRRHRPATARIRTGKRIRVDGRPAWCTILDGDGDGGRPDSRARRAAPRDEPRVRRQERQPRRADRGGRPGAAGLRAATSAFDGLPGRGRECRRSRPRRGRNAPLAIRATPCRTCPSAEIAAPLRRPRRRDRLESRPWPCARARSARTAPRPRSPASRRRTSGCAARTRSATRCATAGRASTAPRRSPTGPPGRHRTTARDGRHGPADGRCRASRAWCSPATRSPATRASSPSTRAGASGSAVVGGEVTPDEYLVSKVTARGRAPHDRPKKLEYLPDPVGSGAAGREVETSARRSPARRRGLASWLEVARAGRGAAGCQQDIEWAIARTGEFPDNLYVLQARPVTVKPAGPKGPTVPRSAMSLICRRSAPARPQE